MRSFILGFILLFYTLAATASEVIFLNDPKAKNNYPFSKATQVGELLFLSGELGVDPKTGQLVAGGIEAETKQLMENIKRSLNLFNSSLDQVAKCTVFLADIKEWGTFNAIYRSYFHKHFPARSALAASGLGLNARVEMECIAVVKSSK